MNSILNNRDLTYPLTTPLTTLPIQITTIMVSIASSASGEQKYPVMEYNNYIGFTKNISYSVDQNRQAQDWATCGEVEGEFEYIIVDSHGRCKGRGHLFIKKFSNIDWGTYLKQEDWTTKLQRECEEIQGIGKTYNAGTTFTCIKIHKEFFDVAWIGDSTAKIISYPSGEDPEKSYIMWKTKDHDARNTEDIARLEEYYKKTGPNARYKFRNNFAWDIYAKNPTTIGNIKSRQFSLLHYTTYPLIRDGLNMTRSLGHAGAYSIPMGFERDVIPRDPNGKYKIIAGTDGFWQVMSAQDEKTVNASLQNGAPELCSIARQRWNQAWTHEPPNPKQRQENVKLPKWNHDDVGVAVWHNFQN